MTKPISDSSNPQDLTAEIRKSTSVFGGYKVEVKKNDKVLQSVWFKAKGAGEGLTAKISDGYKLEVKQGNEILKSVLLTPFTSPVKDLVTDASGSSSLASGEACNFKESSLTEEVEEAVLPKSTPGETVFHNDTINLNAITSLILSAIEEKNSKSVDNGSEKTQENSDVVDVIKHLSSVKGMTLEEVIQYIKPIIDAGKAKIFLKELKNTNQPHIKKIYEELTKNAEWIENAATHSDMNVLNHAHSDLLTVDFVLNLSGKSVTREQGSWETVFLNKNPNIGKIIFDRIVEGGSISWNKIRGFKYEFPKLEGSVPVDYSMLEEMLNLIPENMGLTLSNSTISLSQPLNATLDPQSLIDSINLFLNNLLGNLNLLATEIKDKKISFETLKKTYPDLSNSKIQHILKQQKKTPIELESEFKQLKQHNPKTADEAIKAHQEPEKRLAIMVAESIENLTGGLNCLSRMMSALKSFGVKDCLLTIPDTISFIHTTKGNTDKFKITNPIIIENKTPKKTYNLLCLKGIEFINGIPSNLSITSDYILIKPLIAALNVFLWANQPKKSDIPNP